MDVLWFRLSRRPADTDGLQMRAGPGRLMLAIDRDDYWQVAYVIAKGSIEQIRATGLEALRRSVAGVAPDLAGRVSEIGAWDDVKMLTVRIDRLRRWYAPGVLLIGDAAHAMSPIGGVGINLAVQDAVAAARILAGPLLAGELATSDLAKVQSRRGFPTIGTQLLQRAAQRFRGRACPRHQRACHRTGTVAAAATSTDAAAGSRTDHRGRLAARAPAAVPEVRRACAWLLLQGTPYCG